MISAESIGIRFMRMCGAGATLREEAQDLTQGFFLHLLEHKTFERADPLKGKFRSFLLGSLQNYLSTEAERARCLKRGGGVEFVPLDLQKAEGRYRLEPIDALTPEKVFAARWALALLGEAMNRLRGEYATAKKTATVEALSADGRLAALAGSATSVELWDTATAEQLFALFGHRERPSTASLTKRLETPELQCFVMTSRQ